MLGKSRLRPPSIEAILKTVLEKVHTDTPVTMRFRKAHFASGMT